MVSAELLFRYNFKSGEAGHSQKEPFEEIKVGLRNESLKFHFTAGSLLLPNSIDYCSYLSESLVIEDW